MLKKLKFISNNFVFVLDQHRKLADGEISIFILFLGLSIIRKDAEI